MGYQDGNNNIKSNNLIVLIVLILIAVIIIVVLWFMIAKCSNTNTQTSGIICDSSSSDTITEFNHNMVMSVCDGNNLPIAGTEFNIIVQISKIGNKVTLNLPQINFNILPPVDDSFFAGGTLRTTSGFLPNYYRPSSPQLQGAVFASGNGQQQSFIPIEGSDVIPAPISGYNLQVSNTGQISISGAGTAYNILPVGSHVVQGGSITYNVAPVCNLVNNFELSASSKFINTTKFSLPRAKAQGVRDMHIIDAYNGVVAWAWTDNSNITDQTNNSLNLMVRIGTKCSNGQLTLSSPVQLTNYPANTLAWDTAVAINRTNNSNIVVSWLKIINNQDGSASSYTQRAVSFDGGKSWPINGDTNIQPSGINEVGQQGGAGDCRGVIADKYGNFFYSTTNFYNNSGIVINQPVLWISSNGGDTWTQIFEAPILPDDFAPYDFPTITIGVLEGQYGVYYVTNYFPNNNIIPIDGAFGILPYVAFISVNGLGQTGDIQQTFLTQFITNCISRSLTASNDGKVWIAGRFSTWRQVFKSPGSLSDNWAGPQAVTQGNMDADLFQISTWNSQPVLGMFNSSQTNLYDNSRQALYSVTNYVFPEGNQNSKIYLLISRDNGQTNPITIDVSNNINGNRGFQSIALDEATGDLYFGFYDGRNGDGSYQQLQYFGAMLSASKLTEITNNIPAYNPLYTIPSIEVDIAKYSKGLKQKSAGKKTDKVNKYRRLGLFHTK